MKFFSIFILASQFYFSQDKGKIAYDNDDFQKSYDYYLNILDKRENDVSAKYGAGVSAYKIQDLQNAINFLKEASTTKDKILSSKAHYNLANIYKDENRIEESLSNYKKAIELNPKDQDARINFELLKKIVDQQQDQQSQESQQDQNNEQGDQQQGQLTDKEIQAEAILNALKDQEKINQKQKLLKMKAKSLEKDW